MEVVVHNICIIVYLTLGKEMTFQTFYTPADHTGQLIVHFLRECEVPISLNSGVPGTCPRPSLAEAERECGLGEKLSI